MYKYIATTVLFLYILLLKVNTAYTITQSYEEIENEAQNLLNDPLLTPIWEAVENAPDEDNGQENFDINNIKASFLSKKELLALKENLVVERNISLEQDLKLNIKNNVIVFNDFLNESTQTKKSVFHISTGDNFSYSLYLKKDSPFIATNSFEIPNTICNARLKCSVESAQQWSDSNIYGWGVSFEGKTVNSTFPNSSYFKPVSDTSYLIAHSDLQLKKEPVTMFAKVNIKNPPQAIFKGGISLWILPFN